MVDNVSLPLRVLFCCGVTQNFFDLPREQIGTVWQAYGVMLKSIEAMGGRARCLASWTTTEWLWVRSTARRGPSTSMADVDSFDTAAAVCNLYRTTPRERIQPVALRQDRSLHRPGADRAEPVMNEMTEAALADMTARLAVLEAERAVRRTMMRYMALCDVPSDGQPSETLAELFSVNAVWQGVGPKYAEKFGALTGREVIVTMLARYLPPTPHFSVNAHFMASETIDVDAAATHATGRWIMLQASGYVAGGAELVSARLEVDFVPAADTKRWLIRHFRTQRLFDAP